MNLFKSLLFLEPHSLDLAAPTPEFAPRYGNREAARRHFRDAFAQPGFARPALQPRLCHAACGG